MNDYKTEAQLRTELSQVWAMLDTERAATNSLLARIAELEAALAEASRLLKRAPPATRDMYVGSDKVSWGKQATELAKRIDAMTPPEQPK